MFAFSRTVKLEPTSAERSVFDALNHAAAHSHMARDLIPDHAEGKPVDLSFASEAWQRLVRGRDHPGRLNRRHFEAAVFTYLAAELRTGDVAVRGSAAYANWAAQLLAWESCEDLSSSGAPASAINAASAPRRSASAASSVTPSPTAPIPGRSWADAHHTPSSSCSMV